MTDDAMKLLKDCKEKLSLYRAEHSGAYVGGVEYTELIARINAYLATGGWTDITGDSAPYETRFINNRTTHIGAIVYDQATGVPHVFIMPSPPLPKKGE